MGLEWNEQKRQYVWAGNVRDLVNTVGNGDARMGFVVDAKSGAKIAMNISDVDEDNPEAGPPKYEPFDIESPDGENLYDAYNRRDAIKMLTNIRAGRSAYDNSPKAKRKYAVKAKSRKRKSSGSSGAIGTVR